MYYRKKINRVDFQVAIMITFIVIAVCSLVFIITYTLTYKNMIQSLQNRVSAIYYGVEDQLDKHNFININEKEDMFLPAYQEIQEVLQKTKETTGVMYIYTAKVLDDGTCIYVVDGLDPESDDFRYPGDLIEPEIHDEMREALTSRVIMPNEIKNTSWGYIFIAYLPIMSGDEVIGVLGIEFDAGDQYRIYQLLIICMPIMIIVFCAIGYFVAFRLFRRISNPSYQDLANTDMLTGLKNSNAFNMDINNLNHKNKSTVALLSIDLDNPKTINDNKGHMIGDAYIISCVEILQQVVTPTSVLYRIGGDEFAIIMHNLETDTPEKLANLIETILKEKNQMLESDISLSVGHAIYETEKDHDLIDTFQRADSNMYNLKRQKKELITIHANRRKEDHL